MPNKDPRKPKHRIHPNSIAALKKHAIPFKPNNKETGEKDERINRKGAPDSTASMRALVRAIGADLVQLEDITLRGKKRTTIASRITKKILEMYDSKHPADSTAILKAGWPGLLEEEEDKRPKEFVLRVVYENKRVPQEEELDAIDGSVADGGGPGGAGMGVGHSYGVGVPEARWGLDVSTPENDFHHGIEPDQPTTERETEIQEMVEEELDRALKHSRKGNKPQGDFYCVLCMSTQTGEARSSIEHGGWICQKH